MGLSFPQWFDSTSNWSSLWAHNTAISKTPLLPALSTSINQTNCQFLMLIYFYCTFIMSSQPISIVHTINQIHFLKKEIPFLAVWLSRQLVFFMGLHHCHIHDPFLPTIHSFHSQTNCQFLMHPCIYIYSKPCILIVHHIHINMKREPHSFPMPHFNIPNLAKQNSTF